jgi:hypothetical protein|tara:strand:+ start:1902 stop:2252 length:351 start_codon:yes stop_codon:yes gene_type:complete
MVNKYYNIVNWKKYLIPHTDRIKTFLDSRGVDVFTQISDMINNANKTKQKEVVLVIHQNLSSAISIQEEDYIAVLNLCIEFLESKEQYERCSVISRYKQNIKNKNKKQPKVIKSLI